MTQEEKQLLLKDLCGRLPYGVIVDNPNPAGGAWDEVINIDTSAKTVTLLYDGRVFSIDYVKPYLRPMSSMTEEEFKMVCSMNALTDTELRDRINFPNMFVKSYTIETFDLFNSHHFDYRGLIPMGLALEAPEGMYKTE